MATNKWTDNSDNWTTAADWSEQAVPVSTDDVVIGEGDPEITSNVGTVNSVNDTSTLNLEAGGALTTSGSFTSAGGLDVNAFATSGNATLTVDGTLANSGFIEVGPGTITTSNLSNTGDISLAGSTTGSATLDVGAPAGFGTAGTVTGQVSVTGNSLVEFTSGGLTSIASTGGLSIDGTSAFVADAGATTSNSALTGLTSNAGTLSLADGASLSTPGALSSTGTIELNAFGGSTLTTLDINSTAGLGVAGQLTGDVNLGGASLLEFAQGGEITSITQNGSLSIDGTSAFVADAGALTSNSALTGLASNAGSLSLNDGASITTTGAFSNTGSISLENFGGSVASTLDIGGQAGLGTAGLVTGQVYLSGDSLLEFAGGEIQGIAANSSLSIDGTSAFVADAGATTSNSALTGLTSNAGSLSLDDGASVTTTGAFSNTGSITLDNFGSSGTSTLDINGSAAQFAPGGALIGNVSLSGPSLLEFAQGGEITSIAANSVLSIDGATAFVADAGALTSNSALTGLTSNAGSLSLENGASITTTGALSNTGDISLQDFSGSGTSTLDINGSAAQFTPTGALTGEVSLSGPSLLEFAQGGEITSIANGGSVSINGTSAFIADAGALTSNSALTGLASNAGSLSLGAGASITTTGALSDTGSISLSNFGGSGTSTLDINGSAAQFASGGALTGDVSLSGPSLLEFAQGGEITSIAKGGSVSIDGTSAFVADAGALTSNSALTGLTSNAGFLTLEDGASITTTGALSDTGSISLENSSGSGTSTLNIDGSAAQFSPTGALAGNLDLSGASLLEFAQGGEITGISKSGSVSIDGTSAFVADAGAVTSNSALTGLTSNAGSLSLEDGASITTTGALSNTGYISLSNASGSGTSTLDIDGSAAQFTATGALTGDVTLSGSSLLEFAQGGEITGIAKSGSVSIEGTSAFVADAGALTSNSALTGLASNAGSLSLNDGASITTTGALSNTGNVSLENTSGTATTTTLDVNGSAADFGSAGVLTGSVNLRGNSLLEFGSGEITSIGANGGVSIDGTGAFVADAGALTSNSALTGLSSNAGLLSLADGASITTTQALANTGTISLGVNGSASASSATTLDIGSAAGLGTAGVITGQVNLANNALLEFAQGGEITSIAASGGLSIDGTNAFVADAGALTSNSALTQLASNAGILSLADGASLATSGGLTNLGTINLNVEDGSIASSLTINSAAGFGTAGAITGQVNLGGNSLLEFTQGGELTSIAVDGSLSIRGADAFVADAGALTSNSALVGLASNAGTLSLSDGASITTSGALANTPTGVIDLSSFSGAAATTLDINSAAGFGTTGVLTGQVALSGNSVLAFANGGEISSLAVDSSLSIDGANAVVADAGALTSNSALTGLAVNAGSLSLDDGASIITTGALSNASTGSIDLANNEGSSAPTTLDIGGSATSFGSAGVLTGQVNLSGNSLLEFASGQITGISATDSSGNVSSLSISGPDAFVADAGALTSNSALTGLASNAGSLTLSNGASIATEGALSNTGDITLQNVSGSTTTTTLDIGGSATSFGSAGVLTGQVSLSGNSLLEFANGEITGIANASSLSIFGSGSFVADAGALTSNSALTGLTSNAGSLFLDDGASITTTAAFTNTGSIDLLGSTGSGTTTLNIGGSAAAFGPAGILTGNVMLSPNSLLEFSNGEIAGIAGESSLSIDGTSAFVADAGALTSNSALTGLTSNAGSLSLNDGASITTTGALVNTGSISLEDSGGGAPTTTLNIGGSATVFGSGGALTGNVSLGPNSLLEFTGGEFTSILANDSLSIDGSNAFVADAGALTSNSALTGLTSNAGGLSLNDGASITTTGALANTGTIILEDTGGGATTTTLDVGGSATQFAAGGILTGDVALGPNSLLEFASGEITGTAASTFFGAGGSLTIDGTNAFVADAGALTSNSALTGFASNSGALTLNDGALLATTGAVSNASNTGSITLENTTGVATPTTLDIDSTAGFGTAGVLTGFVNLSGNSLLEFTQGGDLTAIAANSGLSIDGTAAFVADAGALTSNSALTALASNAGMLSLADGASLATPGALTNSGTINLNVFGGSVASSLTIDSAAGFGTAGTVTGQISLGGNSLLEFTQGGELTSIASGASLSINGTNAFVADAGALTSNSALTGLDDNAGTLSLSNGASIATVGPLANTGAIILQSSGSLTIDSAAALGTAGVVTGQVSLSDGALLEFTQGGEFTSIAANSSVSIDDATSFIADAGATTTNSALSGLASNAGTLSLGGGASVTTTGALANTGTIDLNVGSTESQGPQTTLLVIGSAAGLGTAGVLTGQVSLGGNALLEFAQGGEFTSIVSGSSLSIDGLSAFVADAGAFTTNSALAGLADNAGTLSLSDGASITTTGALANTGTISLQGSSIEPSTLNIDSAAGLGTQGVITGQVNLSGSALLEFASGEFTSIVAGSELSLDGPGAFVADAGSLTSNSALTGLASNAGMLTLEGGASVATTGALANTGTITLEGFGTATEITTLDIGSAAGFGTAGVVTGQISLDGNALIDFEQGGQLSSIAAGASLSITGPNAFVADAGSLTSNSALSGLANNAGMLSLVNGASVTTTGALANTGTINLNGYFASPLPLMTTLDIGGSAGFGTSGVVTGQVILGGNALLEFDSGQITGIAAGSSLTLDGTSAFVADAGALTSNSALAGLATNDGTLLLGDGASITTTGGVANTGLISLLNAGFFGGETATTTLDINSTAGFGTAGVVTGIVDVAGTTLLEFAGGGQITTIAANSTLSLETPNAVVADAGATTTNSALTGLADNAGTLMLAEGASITTAGGLTNTGEIDLEPAGSGILQFLSPATTTLKINSAAGLGTAGVITGKVNLGGSALLEFTQGGQFTSIAADGSLSINGTSAFVADAGALASNSALALASNAGTLSVSDGASLTSPGDLTNTGTLGIDSVLGQNSTTFVVTGTLTSSGTLTIGNIEGAGTTLTAGGLALTGGLTTVHSGAFVSAPSITLGGDATLEMAASGSSLASAIGFTAGAEATLQLDAAAVPATGGTFTDAISGFANGDIIDLRALAFAPGATASYNATTGVLAVTSAGVTDDLTLTTPGGTNFSVVEDSAGGTEIVCFAAGTLIRTTRGDVAVERLAVGDLVITAAGPARPIRWLGHRTIDCRRHPKQSVLPVRIVAHAFGEARPARDLYVSPGHAICVDVLGQMLVPAAALVDGVAIKQVEVDTVTYWHVELDSHDILLAENLPCESYLDMGNRHFFKEAAVVSFTALPDADPSSRTHADFCRPFYAAGPMVDAVRAHVQAMAKTPRKRPAAAHTKISRGRSAR